ncbi:MAG TPA: GntR family transcriptional regulator [Firmicutes bacterium]|jgi:DNA-binding LacI/PurR family transcriptional regulator/DNA-binding transcriptional regulator YhcF (GntR family)|nr:GntR family transcriptional regulator [Bacillota bacterium]
MAGSKEKLRYIKVKEHILHQIKNGHLNVGDKLLGERKIAEMLNVSQMTANRAIQELVKEGYLEREMGVGTFVVSTDPVKKVAPRVNIVLFGSIGREEEQILSSKAKKFRDAGYSRKSEATYLTVEYLSKDIFMGPMLRSLMEAGYLHDCEFSFLTAMYPYELEEYVQKADRNRECFVLVNPLESWQDSIRRIGESGLPIVALSAHWDDMGVPYVDTDNYGGAKMAIGHLHDLGHRDIAVFYSWPETANTKDRINGAKDKMKELGLTVDEEMFWNIDGIDTECIRLVKDAIKSMQSKGKRPTAIFAAGFELALAVSTALNSYNYSIPDDMSLIGFDDSPAAIYLQPPLTTIRQPFPEMAKKAISILMSKHKSKQSEIIPVELVIRDSTSKR